MRRLNNSSGNMLVGAVVGIGVTGILATVIGSLMIEQAKTVRRLEDRMTKMNLNAEIETVMSSSSDCLDQINGIVLPTEDSASFVLRGYGDQVLFRPNRPNRNFDYGGIRIENAYVKNIDVPGPDSSGVAEIVIETSRQTGGGAWTQWAPIKIRKEVAVNDQREIVSCRSEDDDGGGLDCLEYIGGYSFGNENTEAGRRVDLRPENSSTRVPAETKAFSLEIPSREYTWESGREGNEDHHQCTVPGATVILYVDKTNLGGAPVAAGKTLTYQVNGHYEEYLYGGTLIARKNMACHRQSCCNQAWTITAPIGGSLGARCPANSVPSNVQATFWK